MSNPYIKSFSKAFNTGLYVVVFLCLLVVATCQASPVHAETFPATMNVICSDIQQLNKELQDGSLTVLSFNDAELIGENGNLIKVTKFVVAFADGKIGTFVTDASGTTCLLFRDIPVKVSSN